MRPRFLLATPSPKPCRDHYLLSPHSWALPKRDLWEHLLATVAIFLPAALLTIAGLYFYAAWMGNALFRRALIGVNAAVAGILAATLWDPVIVHGIVLHKDGMVQHLVAAGIAVAAWLGLGRFKLAPWMIALASALIGALAL